MGKKKTALDLLYQYLKILDQDFFDWIVFQCKIKFMADMTNKAIANSFGHDSLTAQLSRILTAILTRVLL